MHCFWYNFKTCTGHAVKPVLSGQSRGNLYCPFNRGVRLKGGSRTQARYDLKENNIVYFTDYSNIETNKRYSQYQCV